MGSVGFVSGVWRLVGFIVCDGYVASIHPGNPLLLHHPLFRPLMAVLKTFNNARNLSFSLIRRMGKSSLGLQHFFNLSLVHPSFSELKSELKKIIIAGSLW